MASPPSFLIAGAGALGSVYGAYLAAAGHDVQLLAREPHARAVATSGGVRVASQRGEWAASLNADSRAARLRPADVLVVACKAFDTAELLASLEPLRDRFRVALSVQNGVEKDALLADWAGAGRVVGAMSMVGAALAEPGRVLHTLNGPTFLGPLPGGCEEGVRLVAEPLERAGLPVVVTDRVISAEWSKTVHNAAAHSLATASRVPYHRMLQAPDLGRLMASIIGEGAAVASAAGVELDDWPLLFPVRTIASLPIAEGAEILAGYGRELEARGETSVKPSMQASAEAGRRLEIDAIQGFLVRTAARLGVPVPILSVFHDLLAGLNATH